MTTLRQRVARIRPKRRGSGQQFDADADLPDAGLTPGGPAPATSRDHGELRAGDDVDTIDPGLEDDDLLTVSARRAGMYQVLDMRGREVARIRGDYVVGFTTEYGGRMRWFEDLDEARQAVMAERAGRREEADSA